MGASIAFRVVVTGAGGTPAGTVTWTVDGAVLGTASMEGGGGTSVDTSTLSPGSHGVRAHYAGNFIFAPSTSAVVIQKVERLVPRSLRVDLSAGTASNGNGVLEAGETVALVPSWRNVSNESVDAAGTLDSFSGSDGADYTLADPLADYGSVSGGGPADCASTSDCYGAGVSSRGTRPATHWDASVVETLSTGETESWTLHVGGSFRDVPASNLFYRPIETILHHGVTVGCTPTDYCPAAGMTRASMAAVLTRADLGRGAGVPDHGAIGAIPYACVSGGVSVFDDVSPTDPFCPSVHYIASKRVTAGCGPRLFCPNASLTRAEIAIFLARELAGGESQIPLAYGPDPATGRTYNCDPSAPDVHFTDVSAGDATCRHVHYLWARDVAGGFGDGTYRPGTDVTRGQMAKFVVRAFRFELYGP